MADKTIRVSVRAIQEYLRPPGDSTNFQKVIDDILTELEDAARQELSVKSVLIEIDPDLGR